MLQAQGNVQVTRTQFLQALGLPNGLETGTSDLPEVDAAGTVSIEAALSNAVSETVATVPDEVVERTLQARPDYWPLLRGLAKRSAAEGENRFSRRRCLLRVPVRP